MGNQFEWDPAKAASKLRKHGISFELAARVFFDPFALTTQDLNNRGESRWQTLGMIGSSTVVVVVHAAGDQVDDGPTVDVIRIISARSADRKERRRYEQEKYG